MSSDKVGRDYSNGFLQVMELVIVMELESASPPYERVPNISQYTFNNLLIIYLLHLSSSIIRTIYIRNQNISTNQLKNCFKFEITLCHLVSSYIFKTMRSGAKVKMTFGIRCDISKQTLRLMMDGWMFELFIDAQPQ